MSPAIPRSSHPRLAVEPLEDRTTPSGGLDPTFSGDGVVTAQLGTRASRANDVAVQPDGKILAVGQALSSKFVYDFALTRYTVAGAVDTTFGSGGTVVTDVNGTDDWATTVALQGDGKILVGGAANLTKGPWNGGTANFAFALARYNPNGSLDTTFGTKGKVTLNGVSGAADLAVQPDGKIVGVTSYRGDIQVVRLTAAGALDPTFNGTGKVLVDLGGGESGNGVAVLPDGRLVVAGGTGTSGVPDSGDAVLVGLRANGALDATGFGAGGVVRTDLPQPGYGPVDNGWAAVAVRGGAIVAAGGVAAVDAATGGSQGRFAVARFTAAGGLDPTFGADWDGDAAPDGYTVTAIPTTSWGGPTTTGDVYGLAIDAGGRIVLAGRSASSSATDPSGYDWDITLARYAPNGLPDAAFGAGGVVTTDLSGTATEEAHGVAVQADGKVVIAGQATDPGTGLSQFVVARYLGDDPPAGGFAALSVAPPTGGTDPAPVAQTPPPAPRKSPPAELLDLYGVPVG